jgi:hypothetical protein
MGNKNRCAMLLQRATHPEAINARRESAQMSQMPIIFPRKDTQIEQSLHKLRLTWGGRGNPFFTRTESLSPHARDVVEIRDSTRAGLADATREEKLLVSALGFDLV